MEREKELAKTDNDHKEELTKVRMYQEVIGKVLALKNEGVLEAHILPLTSHVLLLNPEFQMVWGYRRQIWDHLLQTAENAQDQLVEMAKTELKLTFDALQRNPKSYAAWFHRQWAVDHGVGDLQKEIGLCNKLLELDERNFHCWNYRRHVCQRAGVTREQELEYSTIKIEQNFSNYSALHHRSISLPQPLESDVIFEEIQLVQQAVFTEPDDQSAWFYYRWLLSSMLDLMQSSEQDASSFLESQVSWLEELREMEPNAKWVLVSLANAYSQLAAFPGGKELKAATKGSELFQRLVELDADHRWYYHDMLTKLQ